MRKLPQIRLVAATAVLLLASGQTAQATTVEEYRSLIVDCRRAVEQGHPSPAQITDLRSRLSTVKSVTDENGVSIPVDTTIAQEALSLPKERSAAPYFATLEGLVTSSGTRGIKGDPRTQADQILSGKEFAALRKPQKETKSVVPNWWVRFTKWGRETAERFAQWLDKLFRNQHAPKTPNMGVVTAFVKFLQFLLYFVLAVGGIVAIYLLARTASARGWLRNLRKRKRETASDLEVDLSGDGIVDPLGNARALAAKGAYRDAVRMAYIASLRLLRENGLLVLEPNKTNWEYQRELRQRSRTAFDTLLPATQLFDRLWYGRHTGTAEEFADAVRVHDALLNSSLEDEAPEESEPSTTLTGGPS